MAFAASGVAGLAVAGAGAAASAYGASQMASAASQSPLSRGQRGISDKLSQYLMTFLHPYVNHLGQQRASLEGATPYTGDFLSPLMPQYGQMLGLLGQYRAPSMSSQLNQQWQQMIGGKPAYQAKLDPTTTAKYFSEAVTNPMMHTFNTSILPQINEGFAGVGAFSSRQGDARQRALSDIGSNLTGQLGQFQLSNQQMQEQLNSQLAELAAQRSMQALQGYTQNQLNYANQPLLAAGAFNEVLRGLQARTDSAQGMQYNEFLRQQPENNPIMQMMMQYIGTPQKNVVMPPNYVAQALQGASGGVGLWQALAQNNQPQNQWQQNGLP